MGRNSTFEDAVRWARCLAEILKQAGQLCSESAKAAYVEVSSRLQVSSTLLLHNGRHSLLESASTGSICITCASTVTHCKVVSLPVSRKGYCLVGAADQYKHGRHAGTCVLVMQAMMYKNSSHQVVLPTDMSGETNKVDLCRTYCMVAAACPLYSPSASRSLGVLPTKELFKVMLSNVRYPQLPCIKPPQHCLCLAVVEHHILMSHS